MHMSMYSQCMNKIILKKFSVKDQVAKKELIRAHLMVVLLSLMLAVQLVTSAIIDIDYNPVLCTVASILLVLVALTSLTVIFALTKSKK